MRKLATLAGALALASLTLCGCAATGALNATATSDVQTALDVGCPILNLVQSSNLSLKAVQKSALSTLELACPPNPPPTSALVAAADLIAAYTTLEPLLK